MERFSRKFLRSLFFAFNCSLARFSSFGHTILAQTKCSPFFGGGGKGFSLTIIRAGLSGSIWAEGNPSLSPKPIQGSRSKVAACPMLCSLVQGGRQLCPRTPAVGGPGEGCLELSRWPGPARCPQTRKAPTGPLLQALLWPRQPNPEGPSSNSLGKETPFSEGQLKSLHQED